MQSLTKRFLFLSALSFVSSSATAVEFSIGGGYPFFLIPEVSYTDSNIKWYANLKMELDGGGPSIGFEKRLSLSNHAVGMVIGTIGMQDLPKNKWESEVPLSSNENIDSQIPDKIDITDWDWNFDIETEETVVGIGVSYSYALSPLDDSTWYLRFESGYGQGRDTHKKAVKHSINLSYQF